MTNNKLNIEQFKTIANYYGCTSTPFIFIIDFEAKKPIICKLSEAKENGILFDFNGHKNHSIPYAKKTISFDSESISFDIFEKSFNNVQKHIQRGDTYLLNLTHSTKIATQSSLLDIFASSKAKYKLHLDKTFTLFSPETFIKTSNNKILSFPMKGTINANIPNAKEIILNDKKELCEHNTIVDLIRNDLALVSTNVKIASFRYIEKIKTNRNTLLQVSSEIQGDLPKDWKNNIGDIISKLLPAGSISGAPKSKTVEIIKDNELNERSYYTGVSGIFNGKDIDSAVNIRFIENNNNQLIYRSGGGITALSNCQSEYSEMLDKVYVPTY